MKDKDNNLHKRDFIYTCPAKVLHDPSITTNELKIYMMIRSFMDTTGVAYPSNKWLAEHLGINPRNTVHNINKLVSKGYLERIEENGKRFLSIPRQKILEEDMSQKTSPHVAKDISPHVAKDTLLYQSNIISKDIKSSSSSLYITSARAHEDEDLEKQKTAAAPKNISSTKKQKELFSPPPEPVPTQQPEVESFSTLTESITPNLDLTTTYTRPYNPYYVKTQVLADEECIRIHKEKNLGLKRTLEEEFDYCVEYRRAKNQPTGILEFKGWLGRARAEIIPSTTLKIDSIEDAQSLLQDLYLMESKPAMYGNLLTTEQHKRAVDIRHERNKMRTTRPAPQPSRSPAPIRLADLLKNAHHQSASSGALNRQ